MGADGRLRPTYAPRSAILSTGEDVPRGQSLRARMLILQAGRGDVVASALTTAQAVARQGAYAGAIAAYVRWLAPQLDALRTTLPARLALLRQQAYTDGMHRRTPDAVASLALGWELWLRFALVVGALTADEHKTLWQRVWTALLEVAAEQAGHQASEDPAGRFLALVSSSFAAGRAHLADESGGEPSDPWQWGWREAGLDVNGQQLWRPQGVRVGWLDKADVFLDPEAVYALAQQYAREQTESVTATARTLWRRLHERGILASVDSDRGRHLVRRMLSGVRRYVLHLHAVTLLDLSPDIPAQSAQSAHSGC